ncbi:hypothetical protein PoB_004501100 [Plakobranchus ocellatus]|uniref:Uncharacterized protein n=1 Tax=Plakobranchus ocellatus TaxID=259542 RepID=A0AAV4B545_9GAST|nr:hypothetical protein PoB_004501100 [Plakobranchus ocellatus]
MGLSSSNTTCNKTSKEMINFLSPCNAHHLRSKLEAEDLKLSTRLEDNVDEEDDHLTWRLTFDRKFGCFLIVSSRTINFSSLFILRGKLSVNFAESFELITINFLNGDQPEKAETLITVGKSFAVLFLATKSAPRAASVHGLFASSGHGNGPERFFLDVVRVFCNLPTKEFNQRDTLCLSPVLCHGYSGAEQACRVLSRAWHSILKR